MAGRPWRRPPFRPWGVGLALAVLAQLPASRTSEGASVDPMAPRQDDPLRLQRAIHAREPLSEELLGWVVTPQMAEDHHRRLAVSEEDAVSCDTFVTLLTAQRGDFAIYDDVHGFKSYKTCYFRIIPQIRTSSMTLIFTAFDMPVGGAVRARDVATAPRRHRRARRRARRSPTSRRAVAAARSPARCRAARSPVPPPLALALALAQHYIAVYNETLSEESLLFKAPDSLTGGTEVPAPLTCTSCTSFLVVFRSSHPVSDFSSGGRVYAGFQASYSAVQFDLSSFSPLLGPIGGGTRVTLYGVFGGFSGRTCEWEGPSAVSAPQEATTDSYAECTAPEVGLGGTYVLSMQGIEDGSSLLRAADETPDESFVYYVDPTVVSAAPAKGSYNTQVLVTLSAALPAGTSVGRALKCKFGTVNVAASVSSTSTAAVRCNAPMPLTGTTTPSVGPTVAVSVSLNGQQFTSSSAPFTYNYYCSGTRTLTADKGTFSDHARTGVAPYRPYSSCAWVIDPSDSSAPLMLVIEPDVDLEPGDDFIEVYNGTVPDGDRLMRTYPTGYDDTPEQLQPLFATSGSMYVRFRTRVFTGRTGFTATYSALDLGLVTISPVAASVSGNATAVVTGQFASIAARADASFTLDFVFTAQGVTKAEVESASDAELTLSLPAALDPDSPNTKINLDVPAYALGAASGASEAVHVRLRLVDGGTTIVTEDALNFTYFRDPVVSSVTPTSGVIGTTVTVRGQNFVDLETLRCRFGSTDGALGSTEWVDEGTVVCVAPVPASASGGRSPSFGVTVSNNALDYSNDDVTFQYKVYCGRNAQGSLRTDFTTSIAAITDHTGGGVYMPNSLCEFGIDPPGASEARIRFDRLDLANTDRLVLTASDGEEFDALNQFIATGELPEVTVLSSPVLVDFATASQALGEGFQLTFYDNTIVVEDCPDADASSALEVTTDVSSTSLKDGGAISVSVLDQSFAFHFLDPGAAIERVRIVIVTTSADELLTDNGALLAYALEAYCPAAASATSTASIAASGELKLYHCVPAGVSERLYIGIFGNSGGSDYIPYDIGWSTDFIRELSDADGSRSASFPGQQDGEVLYVAINPPTDAFKVERHAIHVVVSFDDSTEGDRAGTLRANAVKCATASDAQYTLLEPDPVTERWELTIMEPPTLAGSCASAGHGGSAVQWFITFEARPGVQNSVTVNVEVDYEKLRYPVGNLLAFASIAAGQTHYLNLETGAVLDVDVRPCVFDETSRACDDANDGAEHLAAAQLVVQAQNAASLSALCFASGGSLPQSDSTPDSGGSYRLSACGAGESSVDTPWVLAVTNNGDRAVSYSIDASADTIEVIAFDEGNEVLKEGELVNAEAYVYYQVAIERNDGLDVLLSTTTTSTSALLELYASSEGCASANRDATGQANVTVPVNRGTAQEYHLVLPPCTNATLFFVSVFTPLNSAQTFDITFKRRPKALERDLLGGSDVRAILPRSWHAWELDMSGDEVVTITLTELLLTTTESGTDSGEANLELHILPMRGADVPSVCAAFSGDGALFEYQLRETRSAAAEDKVYTVSIAECAVSRLLVGVYSRDARRGGFVEYTLSVDSQPRAFVEGSAPFSGHLVANQTNMFEVSAVTADRTLVVQALIDGEESDEALTLFVQPESLATCGGVQNSTQVGVNLPTLVGGQLQFIDNQCASSPQVYFIRVLGMPEIGGRNIEYTLQVTSEGQADFSLTLDPTFQLWSEPIVLASGTWQYNFMSVPPIGAEEAVGANARFTLDVQSITHELASGEVLTPLAEVSELLNVYVRDDSSCPSLLDGIRTIVDGSVDVADVTLLTGQQVYIGLRGAWTTRRQYAFRVRPRFLCTEGYFADSYDQACEPCPPGEYSAQEGATECIPCSIGQFSPEPGRVACDLCPLGTFQDTPGAALCKPCQTGTFGPRPAAITCDDCDPGLYQDQSGQPECLQCPVNTNSPKKSAAITECVCDEGFFNQELLAGQACEPCPLGAVCAGGGGVDAADAEALASMPYPAEGYFQDWDETETIGGGPGNIADDATEYAAVVGPGQWPHRAATRQTPRYWEDAYFLPCTPSKACTGGRQSGTGGRWWLAYDEVDRIFKTVQEYLSVQCATEYANEQGGRQCNRCADQHYRNVNNECVPCETDAWELALIAIGLIALAAAMYTVSKSGFNVGALAISVNFFQVTSIFASFQIRWPLQVEILFRFFATFQIGIEIAQPECVLGNITYSDKWLFMMALPIIFLFLLCTVLILINSHHWLLTLTRFSLWFKRKFPRALRKPERPRAKPEETRAETLVRVLRGLARTVAYKFGAALVQTSSRETREVVADSIINAFFMFLTLFYLAAVQKALEPFACFPTRFDDSGAASNRVMSADASIRCEWGNQQWRLLAVSGVLAGVIYGIGIPLSIMCFLYAGRFRLNVMAFGRKFGYLYRRYEREWYFWEVRAAAAGRALGGRSRTHARRGGAAVRRTAATRACAVAVAHAAVASFRAARAPPPACAARCR